jgi:hypothetical protein
VSGNEHSEFRAPAGKIARDNVSHVDTGTALQLVATTAPAVDQVVIGASGSLGVE